MENSCLKYTMPAGMPFIGDELGCGVWIQCRFVDVAAAAAPKTLMWFYCENHKPLWKPQFIRTAYIPLSGIYLDKEERFKTAFLNTCPGRDITSIFWGQVWCNRPSKRLRADRRMFSVHTKKDNGTLLAEPLNAAYRVALLVSLDSIFSTKYYLKFHW